MQKISLSNIYGDAEDLGIEIVSRKMKERTALIGPEGYLSIDYSKIKTKAQEKEILMEEIGHFSVNAFYSPGATEETWARQEVRAKRWVFEKYYPPDDIAILLSEFVTETWEIAEQLELPERFVVEMLKFYKEVRNIDFDALVTKIKSLMTSVQDNTKEFETVSQEEKPSKAIKPKRANYKKIAASHFEERKEEAEERKEDDLTAAKTKVIPLIETRLMAYKNSILEDEPEIDLKEIDAIIERHRQDMIRNFAIDFRRNKGKLTREWIGQLTT